MRLHVFMLVCLLTYGPVTAAWMADIKTTLTQLLWNQQPEHIRGGVIKTVDEHTDIHGIQGIPDTEAYVGRLFRYPLPHHVFPVCRYEVETPSWMYLNQTSDTLLGVPSYQDEGPLFLVVNAYDCLSDQLLTKPASFLVYVHKAMQSFDSRRDSMELIESDVQCKLDENVVRLTVIVDGELSQMSGSQRVALLYRMSHYSRRSVWGIHMKPHEGDLNARLLYSEVVAAGPGNALPMSKESPPRKASPTGNESPSDKESPLGTASPDSRHPGVELSWVLACGVFTQLEELTQVMEHNVLGGSMSAVIRYDVRGWYVTESQPLRAAHKVRRQVVVKATPTPTLLTPPATLTSTQGGGSESLNTGRMVMSTLTPVYTPTQTDDMSARMTTTLTDVRSTIKTNQIESITPASITQPTAILTVSTSSLLSEGTPSSVTPMSTTPVINPSVTSLTSKDVTLKSLTPDMSRSVTDTISQSTPVLLLSVTDSVTNNRGTDSVTHSVTSSSDHSIIVSTSSSVLLSSPASSPVVSQSSDSSHLIHTTPVITDTALITEATSSMPSEHMYSSSLTPTTATLSSSNIPSTLEPSSTLLTSISSLDSFTSSVSLSSPPSSTPSSLQQSTASTSLQPSTIPGETSSSLPFTSDLTMASTLLITQSTDYDVTTEPTTIDVTSYRPGDTETTTVADDISVGGNNKTTTSSLLNTPSDSSEAETWMPTQQREGDGTTVVSTLSVPVTTPSSDGDGDFTTLNTHSSRGLHNITSVGSISDHTVDSVITQHGDITETVTVNTPTVDSLTTKHDDITETVTSVVDSITTQHDDITETVTVNTSAVYASRMSTSGVESTSGKSESMSQTTSPWTSYKVTTEREMSTVPMIEGSTATPDQPISYEMTTHADTSYSVTGPMGGATVKITHTEEDGVTTRDAHVTTSPVTQPVNPAPVLLNSLGKLRGSLGMYFTYTIPADTFYDPDPEEELMLSLQNVNGSDVSEASWLQLTHSTLYGLPLQDSLNTPQVFVLVATDRHGASSYDRLELIIDDFSQLDMSHTFTATLDIDYTAFMASTDAQIALVSHIAGYFRDSSPSMISVVDFTSGSVSIQWTNTSLSTNLCQNQTIHDLYHAMYTDGAVNFYFNQYMSPDYHVIAVGYELLGVCLQDDVIMTTERIDNSTAVAAASTGSSWLVPALLIALGILILLILLCIICIIYRKRKRRQHSFYVGDENPVFANKRKPVLMADELEPVDPAYRPKKPVYMDSDPDPYTYMNRGYEPHDVTTRPPPPPYRGSHSTPTPRGTQSPPPGYSGGASPYNPYDVTPPNYRLPPSYKTKFV